MSKCVRTHLHNPLSQVKSLRAARGYRLGASQRKVFRHGFSPPQIVLLTKRDRKSYRSKPLHIHPSTHKCTPMLTPLLQPPSKSSCRRSTSTFSIFWASLNWPRSLYLAQGPHPCSQTPFYRVRTLAPAPMPVPACALSIEPRTLYVPSQRRPSSTLPRFPHLSPKLSVWANDCLRHDDDSGHSRVVGANGGRL